jgi:methyl-accepting chemotaxis protein
MLITKRVMITLSVCLAALLLVGGVGIRQLNLSQQRMDYISANTFPSIMVMVRMRDANSNMRLEMRKFMMAPDESERNRSRTALAAAKSAFDKGAEDYLANNISNDADRRLLDNDKAAMAGYWSILEKVKGESAAGRHDDALKLLSSQGGPAAIAVNKALDEHMAFNFQLANDLAVAGTASYNQSLWLLAGIIVAVFVVAGLMAAQLFHIIRSGLHGMQESMEQINKTRDFTLRLEVLRNDEIGQAATAYNQFIVSLHDSLLSIRTGAEGVARASGDMSEAAGQVSSASMMQSEASANMAATVEQMTVSINHVAERAQEARSLTQESGRLVQDGSRIIGDTIRDIREISSVVSASALRIRELEDYSGQVSSVINVIGEIADQTNLLALNAAIEAARAGEQGRGFAVVADEVRKLAERTSRSTQEISSTIETMVSRARQATEQMQSAEQLVETGVKRADEADQAIGRIGDTSSSAALMVTEISAAINQQGGASNTIASEVERIAQMSEESSAAAHSTAETASKLHSLAGEQIRILGQYVL